MHTHPSLNFLSMMLFATMLSLPLAAVAGGDAAQNGAAQTQPNAQPAMQLGRVTVTGEKQIIKALQLIKVALRRPESSDPKLANVVVCRLDNEMGYHDKQMLTCGTNHWLSARRETYQTSMKNALANCGDSCVNEGQDSAWVNGWNEYLATQPGQILQMPVNGPAFRALLEKIPLPAPAATTAPAAATHH